jgi:hypothetical protein
MTGALGDISIAIDQFRNYSHRRAHNAARNVFSLMQMAGSMSPEQYAASFFATVWPIDPEENLKKCAASFGIPVMNESDWCPPKLQDESQVWMPLCRTCD